MKQINNGYSKCYYLTQDGKVYNADTKEYRSADKENRFFLKREDGSKKKISLKVIYDIVYNRPYCKDEIEHINGEEWKEIEDTNGLYYVSNLGRIKSYKGYKAILMKPTITRTGYSRLDIVQNGQRVSKFVHRLVASSFLEMPYKIDMQLHHKDNNKQNNSSDNLEWLTPLEHKKKHLKRRSNDNELL